MKNLPTVLGILAGIAGLIGSTFAVFIGGITSSFDGDGSIILLGLFAIAVSAFGIVGAIVYHKQPRIGAYMLLIAGINGLVAISGGYIVAGPLFVIAAVIALQEAKNAKIAVDKRKRTIWAVIGSALFILIVASNGDTSTTEGDSTASRSVTGPQEVEDANALCPQITKSPESYSFKWGNSFDGEKLLYLDPDFLLQTQFTEDWKLDNKPSQNPYASESFPCRLGERAGESLSKLYCNPTYMYEPRLIKNDIDENGNIIRSDYRYFSKFIFDAKDKDVTNNLHLKELQLDSYSCQETSL